MRPTITAVRHFDAENMHFTHGQEIAPHLLPDDVVNQLIDAGYVKESNERRSLFRLFHHFSDCVETETLDDEEIESYTLPA